MQVPKFVINILCYGKIKKNQTHLAIKVTQFVRCVWLVLSNGHFRTFELWSKHLIVLYRPI